MSGARKKRKKRTIAGFPIMEWCDKHTILPVKPAALSPEIERFYERLMADIIANVGISEGILDRKRRYYGPTLTELIAGGLAAGRACLLKDDAGRVMGIFRGGAR